jgi:molybdate transport system substrate-binding protein
MTRFAQLISTLCLLCAAVDSTAEQLMVAVASNFSATMRELSAAFTQKSGHTLNISFGSSGKFYAQIIHGAPFQIFLSADQTKPEALIKAGFVAPASRFTYALGALALWSPNNELVDARGDVLSGRNYRKLAIANPLLAPYGAAAIDVLRHLNMEASTRSSWVIGENIAQTYQFVSTGNAELGFVSLSQIMDRGRLTSGSVWIVPKDLYRPIKQDAVLLKASEHNKAAQEFMTFLTSAKAEHIIRSYGYQLAH